MNKLKQLMINLVPVLLITAVLSIPGVVIAADEDIISSVYLEFDPETGEFVTARDPMMTGNSDSSKGQDKVVEQIQAAQDALVAQKNSTSTASAAGNSSTGPGAASVDTASNSSTWIAGIVVLILAGGILLLFRKKAHPQT